MKKKKTELYQIKNITLLDWDSFIELISDDIKKQFTIYRNGKAAYFVSKVYDGIFISVSWETIYAITSGSQNTIIHSKIGHIVLWSNGYIVGQFWEANNY